MIVSKLCINRFIKIIRKAVVEFTLFYESFVLTNSSSLYWKSHNFQLIIVNLLWYLQTVCLISVFADCFNVVALCRVVGTCTTKLNWFKWKFRSLMLKILLQVGSWTYLARYVVTILQENIIIYSRVTDAPDFSNGQSEEIVNTYVKLKMKGVALSTKRTEISVEHVVCRNVKKLVWTKKVS